MRSLLALTLIVLGGCSSSNKPADTSVTKEEPVAEDAIRLAAPSLAFLETQEWKNTPTSIHFTLPARLVFRDGAVANVGTPVPGRVSAVHVVAGQRVEKNAPLVTLKSADAASARASLAATRVSMEAAKVNAARAARMLERGVGTEREKLDADARVAELQAELARARTTVSFVGGGGGADVIIRAPIAGTVVARNVTQGASVAADGDALVSIGDPADIWVEAEVFERDLSAIEVGQPAAVTLPSREQPLSGKVKSVGAVVRSDLRTATVRIGLEDSGNALRPGMFGTVQIEAKSRSGVLPTRAVLIRDGREHVVFVKQSENTFARRVVQVGNSYSGTVQVLAGIEPGQHVVVKGALLLDGALDQML